MGEKVQRQNWRDSQDLCGGKSAQYRKLVTMRSTFTVNTLQQADHMAIWGSEGVLKVNVGSFHEHFWDGSKKEWMWHRDIKQSTIGNWDYILSAKLLLYCHKQHCNGGRRGPRHHLTRDSRLDVRATNECGHDNPMHRQNH